jgi:hypothetical protein
MGGALSQNSVSSPESTSTGVGEDSKEKNQKMVKRRNHIAVVIGQLMG